MTAYRLTARNTAFESSNRIHADDVAKQYGFRGGLVPGVTDYAYMTNPVVTRWGADWLARGAIRARFLKPLYHDDETSIELDEAGALELRNGAGDVCATGHAGLPEAPGTPERVPSRPLPEPVPDASPEDFAARPVLGTLITNLGQEVAEEYLDKVGEPLPLYRADRLVHPGQILSLANDVLMANVRMGPWIHVESEVRNHLAIGWGAVAETRAAVSRLYEKQGHLFVELRVAVAVAGRSAASIRHVAIYRLRPPQTG